MILIDASFMIAMIHRGDINHARCVDGLRATQEETPVTTWACFAEAMHVLRRCGGFAYQDVLWSFWKEGTIELRDLDGDETQACADLMATYKDLPMDLADATLVAAADATGARKILTFDSDFHVYRPRDGSVLEIIP